MIKIAACFIVKDDSELKTFRIAVASSVPFVDEWHVVANGKETKKLEKFVTDNDGNFYTKSWNDDFSEQRNFIASKISDNIDYYFWMDADDYLVGGNHLRDLAIKAKQNKMDVIFLDYWYGNTFNGEHLPKNFVKVDIEHKRERLIRPGTHTWKARLHETPVPNNGKRINYTKYEYDQEKRPIAVMHLKELSESYESMVRNKRILELQLEEEREADTADPRTLLYLMKIYAEMDDPKLWEQCIVMGDEYLEKSGWDEERGVCCDIMGLCHAKLGDHQKALKYFHRSIEEYPNKLIFYIRLALGYFNVKKYREAKHWLEVAQKMEIESHTAGVTNIQEIKVLFAELLLKLRYNVDNDTEGALEAALLLAKEDPTEANKEMVAFLEDINNLNEACKNTHKLLKYYEEIDDKKAISDLIEALPTSIRAQPFAVFYHRKYARPRTWNDDEICYVANLGGKHFEKWDGNSIHTGIGGSETAVIKLSEEWAKKGYKVVVYGDPEKEIMINGVLYLPWYQFNHKDQFNIIIQWRNSVYANNIKCKKFLVDLHDMYDPSDLTLNVNAIDKIMVKSEYHRNLARAISDDKFKVISNGVL